MKRNGFWKMLGGYIVNIKEVLPFIKSDEQIRLSWLAKVKTFDDVPDVYRDTFEKVVVDGEFPYTLLTPSYAGFNIQGCEKLVFCMGGKVVELAEKAGQVRLVSYPIEDVLYVEIGRALLHSWVKIFRITDSGALITAEYKFNTVSESLFTPIVSKIRLANGAPKRGLPEIEQSRLDFLYQENMKLMNYVRRSMLLDEKFVQIVLQPEIHKEIVRLFGKVYSVTANLAHISVLTDQELILIEEGAGESGDEEIRYGGVYRYVPLNKITSLEIVPDKNGTFTLSIQLFGGVCLKSVFSKAKEQEVSGFRQQIMGVLNLE